MKLIPALMDRNALIELAAMWNDQDYAGSSLQCFLSAWQAVCEVFDFPYTSGSDMYLFHTRQNAMKKGRVGYQFPNRVDAMSMDGLKDVAGHAGLLLQHGYSQDQAEEVAGLIRIGGSTGLRRSNQINAIQLPFSLTARRCRSSSKPYGRSHEAHEPHDS
jgi:hypothetical protein